MPEDTFFESDIVTESIRDIVELQDQVLIFAQYGEFASIKEQRENLSVLRKLMKKQKNMAFRCMMSDSPSAKLLLDEVLDHFEKFGHTVDRENPMVVFEEVKDNLDEIEMELDFCEEHGYFPSEEPGGETPPSTEM